jgi:CBS domain-containing protein
MMKRIMASKTSALNEKLNRLYLLPPILVEEDATYGQVLEILHGAKRGSVIVCRKGKLAGIFTERDVLNRCILEDIPPSAPIKSLMTPNPFTVDENTTLGEAAELMHVKGVRNLPWVDAKGSPKGMLTVGRVIRYLADNYPAEVMNLPPAPHQTTHESEGA